MQRVPMTRIIPSRWQPRDAAFDAEKLWDLARSIREMGLINPIVVFPVELAEDDPEPWYELVAGERRTRAVLGLAWAKMDSVSEKEAVETLARGGLAALPDEVRGLLEAAKASIAATVESADDLERLHRIAVVENLERESLSALEEAEALKGLADEYGWSQRELARRIGKSQSFVAQRMALLGVSDEVKEAVSTRVLTATHARAIARVPKELQSAMTKWAISAVGRDDSPATTRQVQDRARQLAAFVDPARWEPNPKRVYEPRERNRLAVMRWLLRQVDLARRGEALLELSSAGGTNLLRKKPVDVVGSGFAYARVLQALGYDSIAQCWQQFAEATRRECSTCVLIMRAGETPHCRRNRRPNNENTCEGWIGVADPLVIPVYGDECWFDKLGLELTRDEAGSLAYVTDVAQYWTGLSLVEQAQKREAELAREEQATEYIEEIRAFMAWQTELPAEHLEHFQAHACAKCTHYRANLVGRTVPCRFVGEPLDGWRKDAPRAPEFGVLVTAEGWMLPRCEQFAYRDTPPLHLADGVRFPDHQQILEWLHGLARAGFGHYAMWGILSWLDYGRRRDKATEHRKLKRWIEDHWEELGGDGAIATLLDVALSETRAQQASRSPYSLLNPVTYQVEQFVMGRIGWDKEGGLRLYVYDCPNGWPRPWEAKDEKTE